MKRNVKSIDLLKENPSLKILKGNKVIYQLDNLQTLYLYPLNIMDYIDNLKEQNIISLKLIEIDPEISYQELFQRDYFNHLKMVEILLKETYKEKELKKLKEIISILKKKKVFISFFITNFISLDKELLSLLKEGVYIKIMLPKEKIYQKEFIKKLNLLSKGNALLHIKTYLDLESINSYPKLIEEFINNKVDIFQISKELCPEGQKNKKINKTIEKKIRLLEEKYNTWNPIKVISVRDLSTYYYDRFLLREENSKTCYASRMKPYLYKDLLLPCNVKKILEEKEKWTSSINDYEYYLKQIKKCGRSCDDCASIFENDALDNIKRYLKPNTSIKVGDSND